MKAASARDHKNNRSRITHIALYHISVAAQPDIERHTIAGMAGSDTDQARIVDPDMPQRCVTTTSPTTQAIRLHLAMGRWVMANAESQHTYHFDICITQTCFSQFLHTHAPKT